VLLPTEQVPLHIFEPRYRELIGESLEHGVPFGIVYADDDGLRQVGTLATITEVVRRADGDFYLVIEGASGAKTVVEVPDPALCTGSKKLAEVTSARKALEAKFHPTAQPQKVHQKAKVTGFGFFGYAKAREGHPATNGARIMPGLKIDWQ